MPCDDLNGQTGLELGIEVPPTQVTIRQGTRPYTSEYAQYASYRSANTGPFCGS
jgi:hypothetical protein